MPGETNLSEESMLTLRLLNQSGGRLVGRLDRNAPFLIIDPTNPSWKGTIDASFADELHGGGWIEIDESAPISDVYSFQISAAGKAYVESLA
jgi:hypothetical protein